MQAGSETGRQPLVVHSNPASGVCWAPKVWEPRTCHSLFLLEGVRMVACPQLRNTPLSPSALSPGVLVFTGTGRG